PKLLRFDTSRQSVSTQPRTRKQTSPRTVLHVAEWTQKRSPAGALGLGSTSLLHRWRRPRPVEDRGRPFFWPIHPHHQDELVGRCGQPVCLWSVRWLLKIKRSVSI